MWFEITLFIIAISLLILLFIVMDTIYAYLRQWLYDAIPVKQKKVERVEIHGMGHELLELLRRKKLTTLIFNNQAVYTIKKVDCDDH